MTLEEQIDRRVVQLYFEQGLRLVFNRWLPWSPSSDDYEIMFSPNQGFSIRTIPSKHERVIL